MLHHSNHPNNQNNNPDNTPQADPQASPAPQEPPSSEAFLPGAVIHAQGVTLFATDFRAQALQEGVLVDVSEVARDAGFRFPVAVTKNLWEDIHAIPPAYAHEAVQGRLWDVLSMAHIAVRHSRTDGSELLYALVLHVENRSQYQVRLVCGPGDGGEPVITLSTPDKDIDLLLGEIHLTEGALNAFADAQASPGTYLARHQRGDWGELDAHDIAANNRAAREDARIVSAYTLPPTGEKIWLITEWDRSMTTILLPSEY